MSRVVRQRSGAVGVVTLLIVVSWGCRLVASSQVRDPPALLCGNLEHNLNGQRCCNLCAPGSGVTRPCSHENNTECEKCTFGESYSGVYSYVETCKPCSLCSEYSHAKHTCNTTHDTQCQCDRNYFHDGVVRRCRPCQLCPMEYGVKRSCNATHDTVCWRCPEGYYSDTVDTDACELCTLCDPHQAMLQPCSSRQNTVCIDIPTLHNNPLAEWITPPPVTENADKVKEKTLNVIPIYCAVLGAVILVLVIYVIISQRKRHKLQRKRKAAALSGSPGGAPESPPLLNPAGSPAGTQGSDSGVFVDQEHRPVTGTTKVRHLPPAKRRALENSLHDSQGEWRLLASELGYSGLRLAALQARADQDGASPVRLLLADWAESDQAVMGVLVHALRRVHREDCIRLLCGGDQRPSAPPPGYLEVGSQMV